jgi:hypothetical protein
MSVYPRKLRAIPDGMTYHCQNPKKKIGIALCGIDVPGHPMGHTYDYPADFFYNEGYSVNVVRCEKCMTHPDVEMLMLANLP